MDPNSYTFTTLKGGRNNYVTKISREQDSFVIKRYPQIKNEEQRFIREVSFLNYCNKYQIYQAPHLYHSDSVLLCMLQEYIAGTALSEISSKEIHQAADFICQINSLDLDHFPSDLRAIDALDSYQSLKDDLKHRMDITIPSILAKYAVQPDALFNAHSRVVDLLSTSGRVFAQLDANAKKRRNEAAFLSPSDFGFHNSIQTSDKLRFIDFEYSGYDNPIKLVGDFISQPDHRLDRKLQFEFISEVESFTGISVDDFPWELLALFAFKWLLIMAKRLDSAEDTGISPERISQYFEEFVVPLVL